MRRGEETGGKLDELPSLGENGKEWSKFIMTADNAYFVGIKGWNVCVCDKGEGRNMLETICFI